MGLKALVVGGTGQVAHELLSLLVEDGRFDQVEVFTRRSSGFSDLKVVEHHVDFGYPATWRELLEGDVLFSTLGANRSRSTSREALYDIDYVYNNNFAAAAAGNKVNRYVLVSAEGADPGSRFYYMKIKGELEQKVIKYPFEGMAILRPTQIYGNDSARHPGEESNLGVIRFLNSMGLMRDRRPIHARTVAAAMIEASLTVTGKEILDAEDIRLLASDYNRERITADPEKEMIAVSEM